MGLDFDAVEYCRNVKHQQNQPPYACPVLKCDRNYKTVVGLQYHLVNYDHDNPQPLTPVFTGHRKKARARGGVHHSTPKGSIGDTISEEQQGDVVAGVRQVTNPEALVSYNEEEKTIQFNIDGKSVRLGVDDPLPFISDQEFLDLVSRGSILNAHRPPLEKSAPWAQVQVPEARFKEIEDYNVADAPPRPLAYYRFIEKSAEELDGEIEYDVDEEDTAWLEWMNEEREKAGLNAVNIDTMELLMDRLEKESYFQAAANGTTTGAEVDDDAVCCICLDGECQNTNVILFCDMCNLAVHQDCYGVPYIPEGQWLCRRCLQSPSTPVNCVLCPNTGGAFKQTDRSQWAHVVCALWIPEVRFANTVFLEPIDSIETIPAARWRLTCYVCKEKGLGACIQCQRNSCYAAFHVTCAQQAGLYMTMDTVKDGHNDSSVHVQKYAYCHAHTPADAKLKTNQKEVEDTRVKMKEARKALAKKRSSAPVVLIPTIPRDRVLEISGMIHMQKKSQFLERIIAYWTLKRQFRNGVPLLRRLQSQGNHHGVIHRNGIEGAPNTMELYKQLKYWQCLRQDLERARLLCELVRKREKLKASYVKLSEKVLMLQLNPLESALCKLLDALEAKDTSDIFREPVDTVEVPDYLDIVKHPMDLGTMRDKLVQGQYASLEQLETDFDLMIQNCLAYNNKDTVFYRAGIRMRDQAAPLFVHVRKELERDGLSDSRNSYHQDHVEQEVEDELKELLFATPSEGIVQKLLILADKSQVLKNPSYRTKKIKQIRIEITRMRKAMQKKKALMRWAGHAAVSQANDDEQPIQQKERDSNAKMYRMQAEKPKYQQIANKRIRKSTANAATLEEDDILAEDELKETPSTATNTTAVQTPPCSPLKSHNNNSASPVGVNRRTAVLFTRKAQAALKRPSESTAALVKEEATQVLATVPGSTLSSSSATVLSTPIAIVPPSMVSSALTLGNKLGGQLASLIGGGNIAFGSPTLLSRKSPKRQNARHKRLSDMRHSSSMSPKKSPNLSNVSSTALVGLPTSTQAIRSTPVEINYNRIPDSFRVYRANNERDASESDEDNMSEASGSPCSSCSGFSVSGSGSEFDSSEDDDDEEEEEDEDDENAEPTDGNNAHENERERDEDENEELNAEKCQAVTSSQASKNGIAVFSFTEESENSDANENECEQAQETKAVATRTPTPSEAKRKPRLTARLKQKSKQQAVENDLPAATIGKTIENKSATRFSHKKMITRASTPATSTPATTPTVTPATTPTPTINNAAIKSRRNTISKANKVVNNTHNAQTTNQTVPVPVTANTTTTVETTVTAAKPTLEPLQLVWAKCRGYPWYPALILDPKTPKGFVYNGVPLPAPPPDVLALRKNYTEDVVFLVLFFDAKRTWQWLPADKLEILGIDKHLDQQKLVGSRKPTERKAVKKAYQDALHYQSQVSDLEGQGPDPIM